MSAEAFAAHFVDYPTIAARAERVTFSANGCWELGSTYPQVVIAGKRHLVHRLSVEISRGEPLGSLLACHHCDNSRCVNPEHLYGGTQRDNVDDMLRRGRFKGMWTTPDGDRPAPRALDQWGEKNAVARPKAEVIAALELSSRGLATREVARRLSIPETTVRSWIHGRYRARDVA